MRDSGNDSWLARHARIVTHAATDESGLNYGNITDAISTRTKSPFSGRKKETNELDFDRIDLI